MSEFANVRKGNNAGRAKPKDYKLVLFRWDDVASIPAMAEDAVEMEGNITLGNLKNCMELEVTAGSIEITQPSEGENDSKGTKQQIKFIRPGNYDVPWEKFVKRNLNEDLGCFVRHCNPANPILLFGTKCNPLGLTVSSTDNKEKDDSECTLATPYAAERAIIYNGDIPDIASDDATSGSGSIA